MTGTDIQFAAGLLQSSEIVAIPTETVYGLAANGQNRNAVIKIFQAKNRPFFDPLILHTDSIAKAGNLVKEFTPEALKLAEKYWPGPLTLVHPKADNIPDMVTSGLPSVGVRIPSHPVALALLRLLDFPLAAPSANPFGYVSPTCAEHVEKQLGDKVAYILDGGDCEVDVESTIISFLDKAPRVLRKGGLSIEQIESTLDQKIHIDERSSSKPAAPGMLQSHYSPGIKLVLGDIDSLLPRYRGLKIAILSFSRVFDTVPLEMQQVLSYDADVTQAAHNLFASMRRLAELRPDIIIAEEIPASGLGAAINDRLRRAAFEG